MTEHEPGDIVGIFGHKVQLEVTTDHAEQTNSYTTISRPGMSSDRDTATVTVEAGRTFFRYEGELFMFDGVSYRPNSDYRDDEDPFSDGDVDLTYPDGFHPDDGHPLKDLTLDEFATLVELGELEAAENPDTTHD